MNSRERLFLAVQFVGDVAIRALELHDLLTNTEPLFEDAVERVPISLQILVVEDVYTFPTRIHGYESALFVSTQLLLQLGHLVVKKGITL